MALEAVVFPQDPFGYACKDYFYSLGGGGGGGGGGVWPGYDLFLQEQDRPLVGILENNNSIEQGLHANWDQSSSPSVMQHSKECDPNSSSPEACTDPSMEPLPTTTTTTITGGKRKRRRTKSSKNKEEIENQRMTHIAVERNRRKQMNEYLAVLRSLMPPSYVQRGDQASIIGGSINFVKELEQLLQSMEAHKKHTPQQEDENGVSSPFSDFFSFPQYSTRPSERQNSLATANDSDMTENVADIEVTMMETHANLKIRTKKRPRQLLKLVASFQNLRLNVLHLNITALDQTVLYSVSVKVEEGCQMNTVDEIAGAVNQIIAKIEEEASCCF